MLEIRMLSNSDCADVEYICLNANGKNNTPREFNNSVLNVFCRYYIENTLDYCFVCTDGGKPVGYILCAPNYDEWRKNFSQMLDKSNDSIAKAMGYATINSLAPFAHEYPAHLHIDILSEYQGQGIGGRLISELKNKLVTDDIKGLALEVALDNVSAQRFYIKHGFAELSRNAHSFVMGIKLL